VRPRRPPSGTPEFAPAFQRIAQRRGKKIATTAIARKLLTRAWHVLVGAGHAAAPHPPRPQQQCGDSP